MQLIYIYIYSLQRSTVHDGGFRTRARKTQGRENVLVWANVTHPGTGLLHYITVIYDNYIKQGSSRESWPIYDL